MKTASVRQLRTEFPKLEKWLAAGETVSITKRRKIVAELSLPRTKKKPDFVSRFTLPPNYKSRPGKSAVDLLIEERGA
jgi:antitoxin (DNA-binding transcriptional repressor) of toxin-antitoxin stability system